ncbi:MAG: protein kinase [Myxococcota bacterium]
MASAAPALPAVGATVGERYVLEALIGEGGMGAVYAAKHKLTGKSFAIKWMVPQLAQNAEAMQRFVREAQAACAIDHPNVVEVYDVGTDHEAMYLVMELLQGESLADRIERGPIGTDELLNLMMPAFDGLRVAHDLGIVHRDLKPDNIFLALRRRGRGPRAKLLDFGISKLAEPDGGDSSLRLTATNTAMGTPFYMAPEQTRDAAAVDHRADIYAVGCVLYEALTGQKPFEGSSFAALVVKIATEPPPPIRELAPQVPEEVARVVESCLAKAPADRPGSMGELMEQLRLAMGWSSMPLFDAERSLDESSGALPIAPVPPARGHAETVLGASVTGAVPETAELPTKGGGGRMAVIALLVLAAVAATLMFSGGDEAEPAPPVATDAVEPPVAAELPAPDPPEEPEAVAAPEPIQAASPPPSTEEPPAAEEPDSDASTSRRASQRTQRRTPTMASPTVTVAEPAPMEAAPRDAPSAEAAPMEAPRMRPAMRVAPTRVPSGTVTLDPSAF